MNTKLVPLVSVIVTSYNRKNFIRDSIDSVLNSSFKDFELIIVDDASLDGTHKLLEEYKDNPKIRIHINSKNLGQFENRNFSASLATGKYIKYIDSDDVIYKHGLEAMVNAIEQFPEAGIAISHNTLHESKPYPNYLSPMEAIHSFFLRKGFPNSGPSASIINKDIFMKVGGFPKPYYVGTDTMLSLNIAKITGLVKMAPSLNWYRQHEDQAIFKGLTFNEYLESNFIYYKNFLNENQELFNEIEYKNYINKLTKRQIKEVIKFLIRTKSIYQGIKLFKKSGLKFQDFQSLISK